jgi:hypothetical protein
LPDKIFLKIFFFENFSQKYFLNILQKLPEKFQLLLLKPNYDNIFLCRIIGDNYDFFIRKNYHKSKIIQDSIGLWKSGL